MDMSGNNTTLLATLRALEIELHQPTTRADCARLDELLHPDFTEIGRSGKCYTKADQLALLPTDAAATNIWADQFAVRALSDGVAQITYRSAYILPDGQLERHALRSSIWLGAGGNWQVVFHQGTAIGPFAYAVN